MSHTNNLIKSEIHPILELKDGQYYLNNDNKEEKLQYLTKKKNNNKHLEVALNPFLRRDLQVGDQTQNEDYNRFLMLSNTIVKLLLFILFLSFCTIEKKEKILSIQKILEDNPVTDTLYQKPSPFDTLWFDTPYSKNIALEFYFARPKIEKQLRENRNIQIHYSPIENEKTLQNILWREGFLKEQKEETIIKKLNLLSNHKGKMYKGISWNTHFNSKSLSSLIGRASLTTPKKFYTSPTSMYERHVEQIDKNEKWDFGYSFSLDNYEGYYVYRESHNKDFNSLLEAWNFLKSKNIPSHLEEITSDTLSELDSHSYPYYFEEYIKKREQKVLEEDPFYLGGDFFESYAFMLSDLPYLKFNYEYFPPISQKYMEQILQSKSCDEAQNLINKYPYSDGDMQAIIWAYPNNIYSRYTLNENILNRQEKTLKQYTSSYKDEPVLAYDSRLEIYQIDSLDKTYQSYLLTDHGVVIELALVKTQHKQILYFGIYQPVFKVWDTDLKCRFFNSKN